MKDERLLVERSRAGDPESFGLLYTKYYGKVYQQTRSLIQDQEFCLDLTQDIFLKVYEHLSHFRGDSSFSTWLFSIARNHCYEFLRKKRCVFPESLLESGFCPEPEPEPEPELELELEDEIDAPNRIEMDAIELNAISQSGDIDPVFYMKYVQKMKIREIMKSMNLSESAVKMRLHRARKKMRNDPKFRYCAA